MMHPPVQRSITGLFIYPIKGLGGISVPTSRVLRKGLEWDRRWMLVDDNNRFLTQREIPKLCLFSSRMSEDGFVVSHAGESFTIGFHDTGGTTKAEVWGDVVDVVDLGAAATGWFSRQLGSACKLVFFPEVNERPVDPDFAAPGDQTSLSDGYPILVAGEASLQDLNNRLAQPIGMERFRPNLVFSGGEAFEEDRWRRFSIGDVMLKGVKPCARCTVTTIDQATGIGGAEPLKTLASYRRQGHKVLFGQNVIPIHEGILSVGDEIIILEQGT